VIRTTTRTTTGTTTSRRSTSLYNGRLLAAQQETQQNSGLRWWVAVHGGRPGLATNQKAAGSSPAERATENGVLQEFLLQLRLQFRQPFEV
jgi:hypothetical protein